MHRLVWASRARRQLASIIAYISDRNPPAAERLKSAILHTAERLPIHPYLYRQGRVAGTREAVVHPNYILVYRVLDDSVEITSVLHARQNYP